MSLPEGMIQRSRASDKTTFHAEDRLDSRFHIKGKLSEGCLTFQVIALLDGKRGPSGLTGRQFFDALMEHLGRRRIKVIAAQWASYPEELKANLDRFNQATGRNVRIGDGNENREEAAFETYTGRWAKAYNFIVARNIEVRPDGMPGGYEEVTVEFVRLSRKKK